MPSDYEKMFQYVVVPQNKIIAEFDDGYKWVLYSRMVYPYGPERVVSNFLLKDERGRNLVRAVCNEINGKSAIGNIVTKSTEIKSESDFTSKNNITSEKVELNDDLDDIDEVLYKKCDKHVLFFIRLLKSTSFFLAARYRQQIGRGHIFAISGDEVFFGDAVSDIVKNKIPVDYANFTSPFTKSAYDNFVIDSKGQIFFIDKSAREIELDSNEVLRQAVIQESNVKAWKHNVSGHFNARKSSLSTILPEVVFGGDVYIDGCYLGEWHNKVSGRFFYKENCFRKGYKLNKDLFSSQILCLVYGS